MIIYLTYNDQPSGVYWGQVTDVVEHLNTLGDDRVRLVALVSLRGFLRSRRAIRQRLPDAIVLPLIPRAQQWRNSRIWLQLLCLLMRPTGIIARGVFATALALRMRERGRVRAVCFDARAAYGAEWEEFRVVDDDRLIAECAALEREAIHQADLRLAVSHALVDHWRTRYAYAGERHVVVPCTIVRALDGDASPAPASIREDLGWSEGDVVLVYSGTTAGWQSLALLQRIVTPWIAAHDHHRLLFLSEEDAVIDALERRFPHQVARRWVSHEDVPSMLRACDHGLLLREPCVTNQVASPTKFAEYLNAGLHVLISHGVGDLPPLVRENGLGWVVDADALPPLVKPSAKDRERAVRFALDHFTKAAHDVQYRRMLRCMGRARWRSSALMEKGGDAARHTPEGLVSIVVPSFNKARYIAEMVASVQAQTHEAWELLFIDDASTDDTPAVITALAADDPRIKLHMQPVNQGANRCRNLGVSLAQGDHLMFLDADDVLAPNCLRERLHVAARADLDLVVSTMEVFHHAPGDGSNRWVPSAEDPLADFLRHKLPWSVMQPLWKRSLLLTLGGFDETFPRHQDVEFHTRALFDPCVRYCTIEGEPDCFYRIDEERKVMRPLALLEGFTCAAVQYHVKFHEQARQRGKAHLLPGIIYQTHVQLLHNRKTGRITPAEYAQLHERLMDPMILQRTPQWKRFLFRVSTGYNRLPFRIPGVNLVLYRLVTC